MLAKVTNFGRPRIFPTYTGGLHLNRLAPIRTDDREVIKDLRKLNKRNDIYLKVEILENDKPPIDYQSRPIWELKSIASKVGIKGFFTMRKPELIKILEEKNGT